MDGELAMDDVMTTVISLQTPTPVPTLQWKARPLLTSQNAFKCDVKMREGIRTKLTSLHVVLQPTVTCFTALLYCSRCIVVLVCLTIFLVSYGLLLCLLLRGT